jgi:hypothetical protein
MTVTGDPADITSARMRRPAVTLDPNVTTLRFR